jgi:DNA-binding transcriptional LysR family regulator
MAYIVTMRESDLRHVDLNLLVALDALLEEKSVTRAAQRLGMSQPAASRALARLRTLFADALLVDGRNGYVLSTRAEEIRPVLRRTLTGVGNMLEARPFDPAAATGKVRFLMADLEAAVLAPHLLARVAAEGPALDLDILPPRASLFEALENDAVDAIVGVIDEAPAGIRRRGLYEDVFVTLMRAGHPAAGSKLNLKRYLDLGHIVVSITGVGPAPVDAALARMGHGRRVKARVASFLAAMEIAARSDLIMTLPSSLAHMAAGMGRLVTLTPPIHLGRFTMSLVWHARHQDEPRHVWLRRVVVDAGKAVTVAAPAASRLRERRA